MKNKIIPLLLLFYCIGCDSTEDKIQKTWICKYAESYYDGEREITPINSTIFSFKKDTLEITSLSVYGDTERKMNYEVEADTVLLFFEESTEKMPIDFISADSLVLSTLASSTDEHLIDKRIYEPLPNYDLAKRQTELFEELITSIYKIGEDTIEFNQQGIITSTKYFQVYSWNLIRYDGELFIDTGYDTPSIHVKSFDEKQVTGIIYGKENRVIEFTKIPIQEKFNLSNLVGKWERFYEGGGPPLPPKSNTITKKFYEQETLYISDTTMFFHHFYKRDTVDIQSSKLKTYIMFYDKRGNLRAWKIQELTKDNLIVEMNPSLSFYGGNATFKRIE